MMGAIAQCGSLAILTLVLSAPCLAQAGGDDHISIRAGGLMTPALDININLHTGEVVRRSQKLGGDTAPQEWSESRRTLSPTELTHLVGAIGANPPKNWESDECLQQDKLDEAARERGELPVPRVPNADGNSSLYMRYEGMSYRSPENGCETRAFNALSNEAFRASEPPAAGARRNDR